MCMSAMPSVMLLCNLVEQRRGGNLVKEAKGTSETTFGAITVATMGILVMYGLVRCDCQVLSLMQFM